MVILTGNVVSWAYTKPTAVGEVIIDAVVNLGSASTVAFYRSVDCLNGSHESLTGCHCNVAFAVHIPNPECSLPRD